MALGEMTFMQGKDKSSQDKTSRKRDKDRQNEKTRYAHTERDEMALGEMTFMQGKDKSKGKETQGGQREK